VKLSPATFRYRAVSMELAAYLDAHNVEIRIFTDTDKTIAIVCPRDSIFALQKHIEQMAKACPEIATWSNLACAEPNGLEDSLRDRISR
jgi:hypothetical protein